MQRVNAGEINEAMALAKIQEVKRRVGEVNDFVRQMGGITDEKKPLTKRCDKVLTEPLDNDEARELKRRLTRSMAELDKMLDEEFRVDPS